MKSLPRLCSSSRGFIAQVFAFCALAVSLSTALKCDSNKFPFQVGECVQFVTAQPLPNLDAHVQCQNNDGYGLLTLPHFDKFEYLQLYLEVLGEDGVDYWLGYYFRDSLGSLESRNHDFIHHTTPAAVLINYFGTQDPLPPGVQACVAIRKDGMFYRRACSESLPYICVQRIYAPHILSLTLSTSRFITTPGPVTLTCMHSNDVATTWRRNGVKIEPSTGLTIATPSENVTTLTIDFTPNFVGQYECVVANNLGAVVSKVVELVNGAGSDMQAPGWFYFHSPTIPQFGHPRNYTCEHSFRTVGVQFFINGAQVDPNDPNFNVAMEATKSELNIRKLEEEGVYQCRAFNDNGENSLANRLVYLLSGKPGPVETLKVLPRTKTSVLIQWLPPRDINIHHPLLLRYELLYHTGGEFNTYRATSVSGLLPVQINGSVSESGLSEFILRNLRAETQYMVTLKAVAAGYAGDIGTVVTFEIQNHDLGGPQSEIIAMVVPVVCVVVLVSLILIVGVISYVVHKRESNSQRLKTESQSEPETNLKAVTFKMSTI